MNTKDLINNICEGLNPKEMYQRRLAIQAEAKRILTLAECYHRSISVGTTVYSWEVYSQMWNIRKEKDFLQVPRSVAAEVLSEELYSGGDWKWY